MPEFFDAASDLAEYYMINKDVKKAKEVYLKYIGHGKSFIPTEFKFGEDLMIWAYLDNRPFLRLLHNYATFIEEHENISKAIPLFEEIITLNPNDNQGIRDFLSTDYLKVNKLDEMLLLAEKYPSDISPQVVMGGILTLIKMGELREAKIKLKKIMNTKSAVKELLKIKHPNQKFNT
jgi:tetratricopeptide (TPR) repeat protein